MTEQPLTYIVSNQTRLDARQAIQSGIDYAVECLAQHEAALGRTTLKNKSWAEHMEADIKQMQNALKALPEDHPNLS